MSRALDLAKLGIGRVSPNPMVGCVIVSRDKIIGEGWHQLYGGPHAEINALNALEEVDLLPASTVYVTLEPCSHFGKTPPCAKKLAEIGVKKVIVGMQDPNPIVSGKGLKLLRDSGIEVKEGVLREECSELNKRFITFHKQKRPYVILKWAETADGFIAQTDYNSKWISNDLSRQFVHRWRSEENAILVGFQTAFYDNPQLNVRTWNGSNPVRLYVDYNNELADSHYLKDGTIPTICFTEQTLDDRANLSYVQIDRGQLVEKILDELYNRNIQSVIIEGGSKIISKFIECKAWDEARVFKSNARFGKGIIGPKLIGRQKEKISIQNDSLYLYQNEERWLKS